MADIEVRMGDIAVTKREDNLVALGIGSCLVITLYDAKQRIGALAHAMLSSRNSSCVKRQINHEIRFTRYGMRNYGYRSPNERDKSDKWQG